MFGFIAKEMRVQSCWPVTITVLLITYAGSFAFRTACYTVSEQNQVFKKTNGELCKPLILQLGGHETSAYDISHNLKTCRYYN